jgi:sarcosine oxidase
MTDYDVVVAGVGGMGSAATYHLAARGLDVLGLERYDVPHGKGSSHGVTRIIRWPQYEDPAYVPLVERAFDLWEDLEADHPRQLLYRVGSVDTGPPGGDIFEGSKAAAEAHDIPHEVLTAGELTERFPGFAIPADHRAVYQPDGGFLHCEQCTVAHVEAAHREGATVRAREAIEDWEETESGVVVHTDRGEYTAEKLVVTAGAWTGKLLPDLAHLLEPERQVLGWFQPEKPTNYAPENFPVWVSEFDEGHAYGFPVFDVPGFKLGAFNHLQQTGNADTLISEPTQEDEALLREYVDRYFPGAGGPTMRLEPCMFTNTPDNHFLLDTHPDHENVVVGAGFSGHGFKFASAVGEVLADLAIDGDTDLPIDLFRIGRFD